MKIHLTYGLLACIIAGIVTGCTQEQDMEWGNTSDKVIITGSIKDATTIQTRVNTDKFGSYSSGGFSEGDQIGFYSQRGNDGTSENAFQNLCLTYNYSYTGEESEEEKGQSFTSEELGTTPSNWGNVCAYFPYNKSNEGDNIKIFDSKGQLIDLLFATSTGNSSLINFGFSHVFSMLFIIPGQGFSQAFEKNSNSITVVLEKGVANATVSEDRRSLELNKTDDAQKEYTAIYTEGVTINEKKCFYVLLPSETTVDYIVIKDDFNKVQYVRPTSDQLPELARGTRYPITIQMTGDQPTIWPCEFTEWTQTEIEVERNVGIHDIAELKEWVNAYNTYCNSGEDKTNLETLSNYGDYNNEKWTFYLNADMDLSTSSDLTQNISLLLPTFKDVLDGRNHTLSNITLNGNGNEAGIIGNLTEGGTIKNLKLENVLITTTQTGKAIGGIANIVTDGNIQNCKISGLRIDSKGIVGGIAGNITSGEISNNTCSGILTGARSNAESHYIIGTKTEEENAPTIEDNSVSNLIFQKTH